MNLLKNVSRILSKHQIAPLALALVGGGIVGVGVHFAEQGFNGPEIDLSASAIPVEDILEVVDEESLQELEEEAEKTPSLKKRPVPSKKKDEVSAEINTLANVPASFHLQQETKEKNKIREEVEALRDEIGQEMAKIKAKEMQIEAIESSWVEAKINGDEEAVESMLETLEVLKKEILEPETKEIEEVPEEVVEIEYNEEEEVINFVDSYSRG